MSKDSTTADQADRIIRITSFEAYQINRIIKIQTRRFRKDESIGFIAKITTVYQVSKTGVQINLRKIVHRKTRKQRPGTAE